MRADNRYPRLLWKGDQMYRKCLTILHFYRVYISNWSVDHYGDIENFSIY